MTDFNVAVIGAGSMAREHIRAFGSLPGVTIAGLHSRTRARAEALAQEFGIEAVTDSIDELQDRTHADLVVVAVPELAAADVASACFKHNWAVLLEKPAGYDLEDANRIASAANDHPAPVMVGFNRRFYSSTMAILADLDTRKHEKRFIHVQDQQSYAEARAHNHPEEVVERFMYANSIHIIDLMAVFGRGEVVDVKPIMPWKGEETEVMLVHVTFDSGDMALYEGIWKGPGPWACAVSTPGRRWTMQPLEDAEFQNANERSRNAVKRSEDDQNFKPGFLLQARAAIARARGEDSAIVDLEESLRTMRLINRMFGV